MTANELFNLAISYHEQGNIKESIAAFEHLINLYPSDPLRFIALINLAMQYRKIGNNQKAFSLLISVFEIAKVENVDSDILSSAYTMLGLVYESMGYWGKATNCYKTAISINPDNPEANEYLKQNADLPSEDNILIRNIKLGSGEFGLNFGCLHLSDLREYIMQNIQGIWDVLASVIFVVKGSTKNDKYIFSIQTFLERWDVTVSPEELQTLDIEWFKQVVEKIFVSIPQISMEFSDNSKYYGEAKDGTPHGQGTLICPDGMKYIGEFKDGYPNGQGNFIFPDGREYAGECENGVFNGKGNLKWSDGAIYIGDFKNGKFNGRGTFTYADGTKYIGEFKNGKYDGQGILIYANGERFAGQFRDGDLEIKFLDDTWTKKYLNL